MLGSLAVRRFGRFDRLHRFDWFGRFDRLGLQIWHVRQFSS